MIYQINQYIFHELGFKFLMANIFKELVILHKFYRLRKISLFLLSTCWEIAIDWNKLSEILRWRLLHEYDKIKWIVIFILMLLVPLLFRGFKLLIIYKLMIRIYISQNKSCNCNRHNTKWINCHYTKILISRKCLLFFLLFSKSNESVYFNLPIFIAHVCDC